MIDLDNNDTSFKKQRARELLPCMQSSEITVITGTVQYSTVPVRVPVPVEQKRYCILWYCTV